MLSHCRLYSGPNWTHVTNSPLCRARLIKWHRSERAPGCGSRPRPDLGQTQPLVKYRGKKETKCPTFHRQLTFNHSMKNNLFVFTRTKKDVNRLCWYIMKELLCIMIKTQTGCLCVSKTDLAFFFMYSFVVIEKDIQGVCS